MSEEQFLRDNVRLAKAWFQYEAERAALAREKALLAKRRRDLEAKRKWLNEEKAKLTARKKEFYEEMGTFKASRKDIWKKRAKIRRLLRKLAKDLRIFNLRKARTNPATVPPILECFGTTRDQLKTKEVLLNERFKSVATAFVDRWETKLKTWD